MGNYETQIIDVSWKYNQKGLGHLKNIRELNDF